MTMGLCLQLSFVIVNVKLVAAFFPNHLTDKNLGKGTLTHSDITEEGILRAVAAYFEKNPRPGSKITAGELTGMDPISARELFVKYYGPDASEKRFVGVIDDIAFANNVVDVEFENTAAWSFGGESIPTANKLLIKIREQIIDIFKKDNPLLDHAIDLIGQYLHILQMFYSNTNWVEMNGAVPYYSLGIRGKPLMGTAPPPMDTCRSCGKTPLRSCKDNLIVGGKMLTSGYKSDQDIEKPFRDPRQYQTGKCSHGGDLDKTSETSAALGGINKDANSPALSPHHHLHEAAAEAAIAHTIYFFEGKDVGLRHIIGNTNYLKLLQLKAGNSMALVIDYSGSMSDEIAAVKAKIGDIIHTFSGTVNEPSSYIVSLFNDPLSMNKVKQFDSGEATLAYLKTVKVTGGDDCPEYAMDGLEKALTLCQPDSVLYAFTDASAKDPEKADFVKTLATNKRVKIDFLLTGDCSRRKRSTQLAGNGERLTEALRAKRSANGFDLFKSLSESTGGTVYVTSKEKISDVADVIKESALGSTVTVLKRNIRGSSGTNVSIPVDGTIRQFTIKIVTTAGKPSHGLISPNGSSQIDNMIITDVGNTIKLIKIESPVVGDWLLTKQDTYTWSLKITAQSTLDISTTLVQRNTRTGFEYEITGRPVAGNNATLIAKLPSLEMAKSLDHVVLLDSTGMEFERHEGFTQVGGREGSAVFRRDFELPERSFHIALTGMDANENGFLRLVEENIVPVSIQLTILPVNGSLYVNELLSIPVEVTNKGDTLTSITVSLKEDKGFALAPVAYTLQTNASETKSVEFQLRGGPTEGVTTTVTISAKSPSSKDDSYQYAVRRFTTTKRIEEEFDTKDPVCQIETVTGTCDVTVLDPCLCSKHQWFATAEVGDDGDGLFQVSSSIESDGDFSVENFTMGHNIKNGTIQANVSATCCDAVTYINVVDMAGNIGQCFFNVITDNGVMVNDTSVIDKVRSRKQCQTTTTTTTTAPSTPPTTMIQENIVTHLPGRHHWTLFYVGIAVAIVIFVIVIAVFVSVVIVVIVRKRRSDSRDMTVKFVDKEFVAT